MLMSTGVQDGDGICQ
jgi:hypothetical protein